MKATDYTHATTGPFVLKSIVRDDHYEWVDPLPPPPSGVVVTNKGRQCGQCGIRFDYDQTYGFRCGHPRCPTGWNY